MKHTHADNLDVDFIQKLTMLLKLLQTPFYSPVFTLHELINTTRALTLLIQHKQPYTHTHTHTNSTRVRSVRHYHPKYDGSDIYWADHISNLQK